VSGYKSCNDYYNDANPDVRLPKTTTPVLCLNAADDPLCPQNSEWTTVALGGGQDRVEGE